MIIPHCWVVVANASHACIYSYTQGEVRKWKLLYELFHAPSRLKRKYLISDAPGYSRAPKSERGIYEEHVDVKILEADHFAKEISYLLHKNMKQLKFKYLVLVASSHFYSLLNRHLNKHIKNIIKKIITKDYSRLSMKGLEKVFFEEKSPRKADQRRTRQH